MIDQRKTDEPDNEPPAVWNLRLYIAGQSPKSLVASANLKKLCDQHLAPESFKIEVIDLVKHPHLAESDQIIAIPTLVRIMPEPIKKVIGDLSNTAKVLVSLQFSA